MPTKNNDIRIIKGDVASVAEAIKEYLPSVNFKVNREEITQKYADIEASNLQQSVIKLYLSNAPQIVHLHIEQKADEQVQIETRAHLFSRFRAFYYSCLIFLLIGFDFFVISGFTHTSSDKTIAFYSSAKLTLIGISFLLLAGFYTFKSLEFSTRFNIFKDNFYSNLSTRGFENEIIIKDNSIFPELWKTLFLFGLSIALVIFSDISNIGIMFKSFTFWHGLLVVLSVLIVLLIILIKRHSISPRMIFLLVGFELCIQFAVYMNGPIFFINEFTDFLADAQFIIESLENPSIETIKNLQQANMKLPLVKKDVHNIIMIAISMISFILFFSLLLILSSTIKLPIRITRYLNKFESKNQDSYYYKALDPKNSSIIFNTTVFVLWLLLTTANIIGLFLLLSVFEKTLLGTNLLFKSTFVDQFFYNTEIIFTQMLSTDYKYYNGKIFHKIIMLIFSLPALSLLFLILRKNIKSALEGFSLLKKQSDMYGEIEKQLSEQINEVCKSVNVRPPIIKVVESPDIKAETKYLGFPNFKNILIISTGTWNELHTSKDELAVLLAHEIWHIKKHTLIRKFLCFLSDYSLFGNGFLALLQNSFRLEKEADDFAVRWLEKKHQNINGAINTLKSLLERVEEINWRNALFQTSNSFNFSMLKKDSFRDKLLNKYDNASRSERLKINLKLLYQIYFSDEILSYFHPSINQRIAWVEENYK